MKKETAITEEETEDAVRTKSLCNQHDGFPTHAQFTVACLSLLVATIQSFEQQHINIKTLFVHLQSTPTLIFLHNKVITKKSTQDGFYYSTIATGVDTTRRIGATGIGMSRGIDATNRATGNQCHWRNTMCTKRPSKTRHCRGEQQGIGIKTQVYAVTP